VTPAQLRYVRIAAGFVILVVGVGYFGEAMESGGYRNLPVMFVLMVVGFGVIGWPWVRRLVSRLASKTAKATADLAEAEESLAIATGPLAIARALRSKSAALVRLGRRDEALGVFDETIALGEGSNDLEVVIQVANAMADKGFLLKTLGRSDEASRSVTEIFERFGEVRDDRLVEIAQRVRGLAWFCDVCGVGAIGSMVASQDFKRAVAAGFDPFSAGLQGPALRNLLAKVDADTGLVAEYWRTRVVAPDKTDWRVCDSCRPPLNAFLRS
jgi:hypothetical protein